MARANPGIFLVDHEAQKVCGRPSSTGGYSSSTISLIPAVVTISLQPPSVKRLLFLGKETMLFGLDCGVGPYGRVRSLSLLCHQPWS